jgi:hypothetical protein
VQGLSRYFTKKVEEKRGEIIVNPTVKDLLAIDHDADGLPDWEEALWGMDPEKADTDGNGVLDGAEVAPKRQKVVAGSEETGPESATSLNTTELFLQELLITSTALSQAGDVSEEGATALLEPAIKNLANTQVGTVYTVANLKTVPDLTIDNVYAYTKVVNKVFSNSLIENENAIAVALGALQEKDPTALAKLTKFENEYRAIIDTLLKVPVPVTLAEIHLRIVNDYAFFLGSVQAMQGVFDDPLFAYASVLQYQPRLDLYIKHVEDYDEVIRYVLKKYSLIYS